MEKPLTDKKILIVEDEIVFRALLRNYLSMLGAVAFETSNGYEARELLKKESFDLIICDLKMPCMDGGVFIQKLRSDGDTTPIIVISATEDIADIAHVLRVGAQDVLLKPLRDFTQFRDTLYKSLYPSMFRSKVFEDEQLFQDWDALKRDPQAALKLLRELQPPVNQMIANCRINYRQLTRLNEMCLVLDIAALAENELAFYCLDVTKSGHNGVLAALLLRAFFSSIFRDHLSKKRNQLPSLKALLGNVNKLLRQANISGQFPLLAGYYHSKDYNVILVSAGLSATLHTQSQQIQLNSSLPLGTTKQVYASQIDEYAKEWQCQITGSGEQIRLMLSSN